MTTPRSSVLNLPRPTRFVLRDFSLFSRDLEIELDLTPRVFCLAGANGLGKSTFLSSLNYAITGIVPRPDRDFRGLSEFAEESSRYHHDYFDGRIREEHRATAEVEIDLTCNGRRYTLVRGLFDDGLRSLAVDSDGAQAIDLTAPGHSTTERDQAYKDAITEDSGLDGFDQLVFLQHFVLSFDERRELIFWDERISRATLFLAFGADPSMASTADVLAREVERAGSLVRNLQWNIGDLDRDMVKLERARAEIDEPHVELRAEHERLTHQVDELADRVVERERALGDAEANAADAAAQAQAVQDRYERLFSERLAGHHDPARHPAVASTVATARCAVCGTEGDAVVAHVRTRLAATECPLCATPLDLDGSGGGKDLGDLQKLDERLAALDDTLREAHRTRTRLTIEVEQGHAALTEARQRLRAFEAEHKVGPSASADEVLERYRARKDELQVRKDEQVARRTAAQTELEELRAQSLGIYGEVQETFVPLFTGLAHNFLGMDLQIHLETRRLGLQLVLSLQDQPRRSEVALSESQRFFVDIALRMALIQHLTAGSNEASLLIDTPEGSLDITYEAKAGEMFAHFAKSGFHVLMTANINTSKLLERLAEQCGNELMTLERMTTWAQLSEVQRAEEHLFDEAIESIEGALRRGDNEQ